MRVVVVLDMDETLGVFEDEMFHVRPHAEFLIQMLRCMNVDMILWSLGDDAYVRHVVNHYLPLVAAHAYKIFARQECQASFREYGYSKSGHHIRTMYDEEIFLLGVDDQASTNMDCFYDIKIHVQSYKKPDKSDRCLLPVCEKIVRATSDTKERKDYVFCE